MFAQLRVFRRGPRCTLYSLATGHSEDDLSDDTSFDRFVAAYADGPYRRDLFAILEQLDGILDDGARARHFRDEDLAVALPNVPGIRLRLYAVRFGESALVLCSGAEKTSRLARDGATRAAFDEAQGIGRALDQLRDDGYIIRLNIQRGILPTDLIFEYR